MKQLNFWQWLGLVVLAIAIPYYLYVELLAPAPDDATPTTTRLRSSAWGPRIKSRSISANCQLPTAHC